MPSGPLFAESASASGDAHAADDHGGSHGAQSEMQVTVFLFGGLLLGGIFREINKKTGIPYTPMVFIAGIVCGFFNQDLGFVGKALQTVGDIDPHGLLLIFLPILIFESGFNADWHIFKKQLVQILILAIPCVIVSAVFVAFSIKVVLGYSDEYYTWLTAFMFGAILSCTDTVAVLALLKEVGASKKFNSLIEGESLINDGTCMVLLTIAGEIVKGRSMSPAEITQTFLELTLGGTVLGIVFGIISVFWIRKIFNDEILVVNITLISCYLVYYVAENVDLGIKISGIISLVSLGLFMAAFGRTRINSESEHAVHTFWHYSVYVAETMIFLVAGIIIGIKILINPVEEGSLPITQDDLIKLGYLYLCMMASRFLSIGLFMPILKRHGYGLKWKEVFVLTYGGLRGAIGISFALIVASDEVYSPTLRHFILFDMAGCAFLTLVINGTTAGFFVKQAGLAGGTAVKQRVFLGYLQQFITQSREFQQELKHQPHLSAVDWGRVTDLVGIQALEKLGINEAKSLAKKDKNYRVPDFFNRDPQPTPAQPVVAPKPKAEKKGAPKPKTPQQELLNKDAEGRFGSVASEWEEESNPEEEADEKLVIECRNKFLMALKGEYFHYHETNQCGPDAFLLLRESADWDLDKETYPMGSWDHISNSFMNPYYIGFLSWLETVPVLGRFAKNPLFNHLSYVYDVTLNYVNAHEEVEELAENFPFEEDIIKDILKESADNRTMAENYINNNLNVSFPEISKFIKMRKAAYSILNREKEYLEETFDQGQIDDKEFKTLRSIIDTQTYNLGEGAEDWPVPKATEYLKKIKLFSYFSDDEIKDILKDAKEKPFQKDEFIIKENDPADYIYVIRRGVATEQCRETAANFKERKDVNSIASHYQIVSPTRRYHTSVVCESFVYALRLNLNKIRKMIRKHKECEQYVWRESFFFLTRFYGKELAMFETIDEKTLSQIQSFFTFKKYKPQSVMDFTKGGIFLKGQAIVKNDNPDEEVKKLNTLTYIPYATGREQGTFLVAERYCWVFHSNNTEKVIELIATSAAEKDKNRSRSFQSFRTSNKSKTVVKPQSIRKEESDRASEHSDYAPPSGAKMSNQHEDI